MFFFFFKQKTAYEMRISDWSSDVCSSDLGQLPQGPHSAGDPDRQGIRLGVVARLGGQGHCAAGCARRDRRVLRAHPPLQSDRHGRTAPAVQGRRHRRLATDRKSVVKGKSVSVRVDLGGRRIIKKKNRPSTSNNRQKQAQTTKK